METKETLAPDLAGLWGALDQIEETVQKLGLEAIPSRKFNTVIVRNQNKIITVSYNPIEELLTVQTVGKHPMFMCMETFKNYFDG